MISRIVARCLIRSSSLALRKRTFPRFPLRGSFPIFVPCCLGKIGSPLLRALLLFHFRQATLCLKFLCYHLCFGLKALYLCIESLDERGELLLLWGIQKAAKQTIRDRPDELLHSHLLLLFLLQVLIGIEKQV